MSWKEILKQDKYVDKYMLGQMQIDRLIENAFYELEEFYKERLDSILTGEHRGIRNLHQQLSQFPDEKKDWFVYPVAAAVDRAMLKDEPLLDKLIKKLRYYYAYADDSGNGFEGGIYADEWDNQVYENIKKDTLDFFEEHLTTQKYVDLARDTASNYEG